MSLALTQLILDLLNKLLAYSQSNPNVDLQNINEALLRELPDRPESRKFIVRMLDKLIADAALCEVTPRGRDAIRYSLSDEESRLVSQCQTARRFCDLLRLINIRVVVSGQQAKVPSGAEPSPEPLPLDRPIIRRRATLLTVAIRAYLCASVLLLLAVLCWIVKTI
jgi:hypothetical protein